MKEDSSSSEAEEEEEEEDDEKEKEDNSSEEEEEIEPFPEERENFLQQLYKFMEDRGTPINKRPVLGYRNLNLLSYSDLYTNLEDLIILKVELFGNKSTKILESLS